MATKVKPDDTLAFYTSLVEDVGMTVEDDGFLYFDFGDDDRVPIMIDDRHLFLPTKERLKKIDVEKTVAFHPLCQNILRGDSQVLKGLKKFIAVRLSTCLTMALVRLGELAIDTDRHETLKPKQAAFLKDVTDYKKRTHAELKKLIKGANFDDRDKALVSLYIKKGGKVSGRQYSQACIASFPMRHAMDSESVTVNDVKFYSHKDKDAAKALFDYVLPEYEKYSQGSNVSVAPNLDALIKTFYKIAKQLNKIYDRFDDIIPEFEAMKFNLEWYESRDLFKEMSLVIPPLDGNDGEPVHARSEDVDNPMRQAANVHTGHQSAPEAPAETRIGFSGAPAGNEPVAAETVETSDSHGLEWSSAKQQVFGGPPQTAQPNQWQGGGYNAPAAPGTAPYGYPQQSAWHPQPVAPQPQPSWGGGPNYNSGYVSRAQRSGAGVNMMGQAQQDTPPWVASHNTPAFGGSRW